MTLQVYRHIAKYLSLMIDGYENLYLQLFFSDSSDEGDNAITHPLLFDQRSDSDESLPDLDLPCLPGSNSQQKSPETNVQTLSNSWESTQSSYNPSPPLDVYGDIQSSQPRNWQGRHQETDNESSDDTIFERITIWISTKKKEIILSSTK